ncbi:hypothetical protein AAFF_G00250740 [Aldrovandia affinis]|uniref:Uncharacterized protein n=1 Tax=Aldrovandia affinis TaxID=143900 RepID=A0AAD7W3U2_9TELE|nr:hypothetical protein AAFF_G00250740 [Aldrovandia affinis]
MGWETASLRRGGRGMLEALGPWNCVYFHQEKKTDGVEEVTETQRPGSGPKPGSDNLPYPASRCHCPTEMHSSILAEKHVGRANLSAGQRRAERPGQAAVRRLPLPSCRRGRESNSWSLLSSAELATEDSQGAGARPGRWISASSLRRRHVEEADVRRLAAQLSPAPSSAHTLHPPATDTAPASSGLGIDRNARFD